MKDKINNYLATTLIGIFIWVQGLESTMQLACFTLVAALTLILIIKEIPTSIDCVLKIGIVWYIMSIIRFFDGGIIDKLNYLEAILFFSLIPLSLFLGYNTQVSIKNHQTHLNIILLSIAIMISMSIILYCMGYTNLIFYPNYPWEGLWKGYISGVFSYKNHLGYFSLVIYIFTIISLKTKSKIQFCLFIISILGILSSDSRLAVIGMLLVTVITFSDYINKYLIGIVSVPALFILYQAGILDDNGRYLLYEHGVNALSDNWLRGLGLMEYQVKFPEYINNSWGSSEKAKYLHNGFLQILINQGFIQGSILITIIIYPFIYCFSNNNMKRLRKTYLTYLIVSIIYINLDYIFYLPFFVILYFYIFGLYLRVNENTSN